MGLYRLIYVSTKTEQLKYDSLEQILGTARRRNTELGITGILCFNRKYFLQCLEGNSEALNSTYHRIAVDDRHEKLQLITYEKIHMRDFDTFAMGYVPESTLTGPLMHKHSNHKTFEPYTLEAQSAHALLLALKDKVPTI